MWTALAGFKSLVSNYILIFQGSDYGWVLADQHLRLLEFGYVNAELGSSTSALRADLPSSQPSNFRFLESRFLETVS